MTEPAADRPSLTPRPRPGPRNPLYAFLYHCVLSRNIIPSSHLFLSPSRCILRSCVIRPHAHPWPRTPAGQAAPPHIFRRCPPGCAHASGLLLTPPRAMRCEPALCCGISDCFFPPKRWYAGDGLLTSPIIAATLPLGPPLRHTNSLPAQRAPPANASRIFTGILV